MRWILFVCLAALALCFPPVVPLVPVTMGVEAPVPLPAVRDELDHQALKFRRGFCYGAIPEHWYGSELRNRAHVWFCAALARGEALKLTPVTPRLAWQEFAEMSRRRAALATSGGDL